MSRWFARRSKTPSPTPSSPPAARAQRAWWRDLRVVAGVGIVLVCTVIGASAASAGDDTVNVWRLTRDLSAGATPTLSDVEAVAVPRDAASTYAEASAAPSGRLARDVTAGELLPVLDATVPADVRWVTVPVEPLHAPADLAPGERVDVWSTAAESLGETTAPELVLGRVLVSSVAEDAAGFGGEYGVILEVPPTAAAGLLAAVRSGAIDLVRVPTGGVS